MFCEKCGNELINDAQFCTNCGTKINVSIVECMSVHELDADQMSETNLPEKYKNIFNDKKTLEKANDIKKYFGIEAYIRFIKERAKEMGMGDIDLSENDMLKVQSISTATIKTTKKRHGFTSFWLIFCLIGGISGALMDFFGQGLLQSSYAQMGIWVNTPMFFLLGILAIGSIVGFILLLKWRKIGFYIIIGLSVVSFITNIAIGLGIGMAITGLISIAILWGVLYLKKNDKNTWEQLQ